MGSLCDLERKGGDVALILGDCGIDALGVTLSPQGVCAFPERETCAARPRDQPESHEREAKQKHGMLHHERGHFAHAGEKALHSLYRFVWGRGPNFIPNWNFRRYSH